MNNVVICSKDGDVGILTIKNPPVNALSSGVLEGIVAGLGTLEGDGSVHAVVLIGDGRTFVAGADIRELRSVQDGERDSIPDFAHALARIENSEKPVVAAIHGTALGGGLEIAMACHYRIALSAARMGQPEVHLGIIPGAGGTQRLPRLAGVEKALQMCATGDPISANEAYAIGVVDHVVEGEDLLHEAVSFARTTIGKAIQRTCELDHKLKSVGTSDLFTNQRALAKKMQRNREAPLLAIAAVEAATELPFSQGLQREAELFNKALRSDQSKALVHVFLKEREVSKIPGVPDESGTTSIRQVAVVGAGTMGSGIAMVFANAGIPVVLKETDSKALDRGIATIRKTYANSVTKGRLTAAEAEKRIALITPTLYYADCAKVDLVVEAVFESMDIKKKVFAELDRVTNPTAILATNTSTLDIDQIAAVTTRPSLVIGLHFFSPANVMRLLEVVRGKATSSGAISICMAMAKRIGKVGVLVGNCTGFVGNRMFFPYIREAQFLIEEGATVEEVDAALYDFGMAMGPLATSDLTGLDVLLRIRNEHPNILGRGGRKPQVEDLLCEAGHYGQKTASGWYVYDENRRPSRSPVTDSLIQNVRKRSHAKNRPVSPEEIVERTIYALLNEGARILEEGYALRAGDIDVIYTTGYGFPSYRGGPMWHADTIGLPHIYKRILEWEKQFGEIWTPAPLLKTLVESGQPFASLNRGVLTNT